MLPTSDSHPDQKWLNDERRLMYLRGVVQEVHPMGRVKETKEGPIVEQAKVNVGIFVDPDTGIEERLILDPNHPQKSQQLRAIQEVIQGKTGGMWPLKIGRETKVPVTPEEGNPIAAASRDIVGVIETPEHTQDEATLRRGGKTIGKWSPKMDAAVDKAVSFKVAESFATYMRSLENGDAAMWTVISQSARRELAEQWAARGMAPDEIERNIDRFLPTYDEALKGMHSDASGLHSEQSVWSPPAMKDGKRTVAEDATYAMQSAMIATFSHKVSETPPGHDLYRKTVVEMQKSGSLPVDPPMPEDDVVRIAMKERCRDVGSHLLAGYMAQQGAAVRDPMLEANLHRDSRLHRDIIRVMEESGVPEAERPKHYFDVAKARAERYHESQVDRVKSLTAHLHPEPPAPDDELGKAVSERADSVAKELGQAGNQMEGISLS